MNEITTTEEQQRYIFGKMREFKRKLTEKNSIQRDMKPILQRIKKINQELHAIENDILKYMHEKNHPAMRFEDCVFTIKKKLVRPKKKEVEQKVMQIFQSNKIENIHLCNQIVEIVKKNSARSGDDYIECALNNNDKKRIKE